MAQPLASRLVIGIAGISLLALSTGCPDDPFDPQTHVKSLGDPHKRDEAVTKLEQLKCPEAIKPLGKAWKKYNKDSRILRVIITLANQPDAKKGENQDCKDAPDGPYWKDAIPVLVESVEEFDIGDRREIEDAVVAADALGNAADPETVQTLISVATRKMPKLSEGQRVRIAAIRALGSFGSSPRAVDTLIKILNTDPNEQPIRLNAAAANALAETRSEKAIQPLLMALFEVAPIYQQVRTALTRVGDPVVPELIKIFEGKHAEINKLADKHGFAKNCEQAMGPQSECKAPGNLRFKAAALLGDLRADKAMGILVKGLSEPARVSFFDPKTGAPGPPDHNAILDALRNMGATKHSEEIRKYATADSTDDQTRPLALDVYSMLSRDTSALDYLSKTFQDSEQEEQIRSAAALAYARLVRDKKQLAPLQKIVDMQLEKAKENDAKATKAKDAEKKEEHEAIANDYRTFAREYEQHKTRAKVGAKCKDDAACYASFLDMKAEDVIATLEVPNHRTGEMKKQDKAAYRIAALERALLELSKLGEKAQSEYEKLLGHVESTDRIIRQGVLLALVQTAPEPCDKCVATLSRVIADQENQTTLDYLTADTRIVNNYFISKGGKASGGGAAAPAPAAGTEEGGGE